MLSRDLLRRMPERDWALVMLTNAGPNGPEFMQEIRRPSGWACLAATAIATSWSTARPGA